MTDIRPLIGIAAERPLIRHHHEWYNGSGYPDRLIGEEIPLLARIVGALGIAKINIVALTMMDASEHGVLRIVARDADKARLAARPGADGLRSPPHRRLQAIG